MLGLVDDVERHQPSGGVDGHLGEHALEPLGHLLDAGGVEHVGVVFDAQAQFAARQRHHRQRVVVVLAVGDIGDGQLVEAQRHAGVDRVVLVQEQGVEQGVVAGHAVNLAQRQVLVFEGVVVVLLQLVQHVGDGGLRVDVGAHRDGVDQQAHHRFGAGQVGGPTGDGGAERHVVVAGEPHQQLRPPGLQHGVDGRVARAGQLAQGARGFRGEPVGLHGPPAEPHPAGRAHQGGGVESVEHLAPRRLRGGAVLAGQPGQVAAVGRGRGQLVAVVVGQDLAQQDGQRPAVHHDVVVGEHEPVPVVRGADQRGPERRPVGQVAHRGALGGAQLLDPLFGVGVFGAELNVAPRHDRVGRDHLDGFAELRAEPGRQVGVAVHHGVHRLVQPVRVQGAGHGDAQLHRVDVVARVLGEAGVEEQALLQRGQRQDVGDLVLLAQLVDLPLVQARRRDVGRGQPAAAGLHVGADAGQGLEPQPAELADLLAVHRRGRPRPVGVQVRALFGVHGAGVEVDGVHERHRHRGGRAAQRQAVGAQPPQLAGQVGGRAEPTQVVEADHRVGSTQIDVGVQVAQQAVGQPVGQGAQLLLGGLDGGAQRVVTAHHAGPVQPVDGQGHRVLGGEPPHGARQVNVRSQLFLAAVTLDVDADRRASSLGTQEFRPGHPERDQQNVLHPGVERRGHLTQQQPGGLDVQRHRQLLGRLVGVLLGSHRRQQGRGGHHLAPGVGLLDDRRALRVLGEQRRPPGERSTADRQGHRLTAVVLRPGDVEVLDQGPPRHTVDGHVVDDQRQLACLACPYGAHHRAGARVQPRPRLDERRVGQGVDGLQAVAGLHRARVGRVQLPAALAVVFDAQPQHRVAVQQGLQHDDDLVGGDARGGRQHHGLVEVVDRAVNGLQPAHDRGGHHRADPLVDHVLLVVAVGGHAGQPGHGLLDEHVAGAAHHACGAGAGHDLHGQDAVAAQVEERVVDADALHTQHLGVDAGQDLLGVVGRGAVLTGALVVLRRGQGALVELAVDRQRQRLEHHHGGGDHVGGQPLAELGAQLRRVGGAGDVADEALVAGAVLAGDDRGLVHAVERREGRLDLAEFDAVAADLDLLVGAAQVLQLTVGAPAHQVAGAVHPRARAAEGAGHEPRRRQAGPSRVPGGHAAAGHVQLTDHALGRGPQPLVQDEQRRAGHRRADRRRARVPRQRRAHRGVDGGLGRAVGVDHHASGRPPVDDLGGAGLAGHHQRRGLQALGREHPHRGRGLAQHVDLLGDK